MYFVQRSGDTGSFAFDGDEARILKNGVVVVDWTSGGVIDGIPAGGGYTVEMRSGDAIVSDDLNVGIMVLTLGQSNMTGWFTSPTRYPQSDETFMLGPTGWAPVVGAGAQAFANLLS